MTSGRAYCWTEDKRYQEAIPAGVKIMSSYAIAAMLSQLMSVSDGRDMGSWTEARHELARVEF